MQREVMKSSSAVRRVKFAKTPAEGSGVCLKDAAEGGGQQQCVALTPIVFSDNPQSPVPSPDKVSLLGSPEVGEVSSDYSGNPAVATGVVEGIMTSCVASDSEQGEHSVTSQRQQPESTQGTTAAATTVAVAATASTVRGGLAEAVHAQHASATEHHGTPVIAAMTTATASPARSNDSLKGSS